MLHSPTDCDETRTYIGRGGVRVQICRGIKVAVKELLPRSLASDVCHEAGLLTMFYLPLFGVHTATQSYKIVMQYHSHQEGKSTTLHALSRSEIRDHNNIDALYIQLMEAV